MSRINTYPEADSLNQDDFLVIDGATDGTRKVKGCLLDNKEALDVLNGSNVTWTVNAYINKNNGNMTTNHPQYDASDFIKCGDIDTYLKTVVFDDTAGIAFYDSSKTFISGYNPFSDNGKLVKLTVPERARFFRVSCKTGLTNEVVVTYGDIPKYVRNLIQESSNNTTLISNIVEYGINLLPVDNNTVTVFGVSVNYIDGILTASGTATQSGGRNNRISKVFTLPSGTYMASNFDTFSADPTVIIANASDNTVVASIYRKNNVSFTLTEETSLYVGVNVSNGSVYSGTYHLQIVRGDTVFPFMTPAYVTSKDHIARETIKTWSYAMGKILCIGDSLTSGANYTGEWGGASIDQNYPHLLGRMLNADTTNAGVSGINASGWYNNYKNRYTFSDYDTFIIWLGTNQGLTDTLDTDVNPYSDYNDFADTNTGNYCKIIETIKADNPSCLIVLVTLFSTTGDLTDSNSAIRKIASKYSLPIVDNSELTHTLYPKLHGSVGNPHFSKAGNIYLANRFATELNKYFEEDISRADYGETPRTN